MQNQVPSPNKTEHAIEVHLHHQTTWQHTSCEVPSFIARVELRTGQYCSCSIFSLSVKRAQELTSLPHPKLITHQPTYLPTHLPKPLPTHLPTHLPIEASTNPLPYPPTKASRWKKFDAIFFVGGKLEPTHTISPTIHAFCHLA